MSSDSVRVPQNYHHVKAEGVLFALKTPGRRDQSFKTQGTCETMTIAEIQSLTRIISSVFQNLWYGDPSWFSLDMDNVENKT